NAPEEKISGNLARDARKLSELSKEGWRIAVIWECVLKKAATAEYAIEELTSWLRSQTQKCEIPEGSDQNPR
ncbi:MAG: hypothetical protein ETSY2_47400, partial [Candidatus Entotheonella gemina]